MSELNSSPSSPAVRVDSLESGSHKAERSGGGGSLGESRDVGGLSPGLDRQQITSHRKLGEFENNDDFSKVKADCIRYLMDWGYTEKAEKFRDCSKDLAVFECLDCGHKFSAPITCGLRVCPSCRKRLRSKFVESLSPKIEDVDQHRHLTLTIPNLPLDSSVRELRLSIRDLKKAFGKLRRREYFSKRVKGTAYGIEVKQGEKGYNLHLHAFLALEDWVRHSAQFKYKKIAKMWCEYFPEAEPSAQEFREHKSSKTAMVEVVSYATKGVYFKSGLAMARWVVSASGSRLIGRTGCFFDAVLFLEKNYTECPFCASTNIEYFGRWSELKLKFSFQHPPPPTISEVKKEQSGGD